MMINDLIELKTIRSVIQLGLPEDRREAIDNFVVTEDIALTLEDFIQRIHKGEGGGIFLKGHYGTGKSHLLSWIEVEAESGWSCTLEKLKEREYESLTPPPRLYPIAISLIQHPSKNSLEAIVEQVTQHHAEENNTPFSIQPDSQRSRKENYNGWLEQLRQAGYQGWLIIFDELSEFLKSKSKPSELSEDMRYLQFLSEYGRDNSCWTLGAIQEDLEGIGSADRETSLKLKDRFELRWNLSSLHIEQMIPQRLIQHKNQAKEYLDRLYFRCQELWPETFKRHATFLSTYPLHPDTLHFLMNLGPLFSEHRGALKFTQDLLSGNWGFQQSPHLEKPSHELLNPSYLFDYFENRFNENLELKAYYQKAWLHLQQKCCELLDPRDHLLGQQVIKIIILSSIDPKREGIALDELNGMLLFQIDGDSSLGQQYLQEHIVLRLLNRVNYLQLERERLRVDLHHQQLEMLDRVLEKKAQQLQLSQPDTWNTLFQLLDEAPLEFKNFWDNPQQCGPIVWLNTLRKINLSFGSITEDPKADLIIALPECPSPTPSEHQLLWSPRKPSPSEIDTLQRAAAVLQLSQELPQTSSEQQLKLEAQKRKKSELGTWRSILQSLYREGRWHLGKHLIQTSLDWHSAQRFEVLIEAPIYECLSKRHPLFRSISPKINYYTDRSYIDLIEHLVTPGEVKTSQLKNLHLEDALHGLAIPLNIAQKVRQDYRFIWEPSQNPLVEVFCQTWQREQNLEAVCQELAAGPWGLPQNTTHFLTWAAIASGHMIAERDGEQLPPHKISFNNIQSIDKLKPASSLDREIVQQLCQHRFFKDCDQSFTGLSLERQLWSYTQSKSEALPRWLDAFENTSLQHAWSFCQNQLSHHQDVLNAFLQLVLAHKLPHDGLKACSEKLKFLDQVPDSLAWGQAFYLALKKHDDDLHHLWQQLNDEFHQHIPASGPWLERQENRIALLREFQDWENQASPFMRIETWIKQSQDWLQDYRKHYQQSHAQANDKTYLAKHSFLKNLEKHGLSTPSQQRSPACERNIDIELQQKPYCRCGFTPSPDSESTPENDPHLLEICRQHFHAEAQRDGLLLAISEKNWTKANQILESFAQPIPKKHQPKKLSIAKTLGNFKGKTLSKKELIHHLSQLLEGGDEEHWTIED